MQLKKIFLVLMILIISANLVSAALIAHYSFDNDLIDGGPDAVIYDASGTDPPNDGTFNKNTKLLMSFDNDNTNDESGYDNNGKHYGNTRLLMSFDGGTATDLSDYRNDGVLNGNVDCTQDTNPATPLSGKYCSLDGDGDYVSVSTIDLNTFTAGTMSAWVKFTVDKRMDGIFGDVKKQDVGEQGIGFSKYDPASPPGSVYARVSDGTASKLWNLG